MAYATNTKFSLDLPSGRSLNYGEKKTTLQHNKRNYTAMITKGAKKIPVRLWGGLLAENISQALARCVFSDMMLRIEEAGLDIIFHVHDEVVIETDKDKADHTLSKVLEIMKTPPSWIPDIPLDAEGKVLTAYEK